MRNVLSVATLLVPVASATARADVTSLDAVKAAVTPGLDKLAGAIMVPFSYEGLTYVSTGKGDLAGKCEKKFGAHGTVTKAAQVPAFVDCLAISDAATALLGKPTWSVFDPAHAGDLMTTIAVQRIDKKISKGYDSKLKKAPKGSVFVVHTTKPDGSAGDWDEAWTIFHAHQEAVGLKLDGVTAAVSYVAPG